MNITARASHISHSPRKVNLVAETIVGLPAHKALEKLSFTMKRASYPVAKVLRQAIGNAVNNFKVDAKTLIIERAYATKGRVLKRGLMGGRSRYKPFERTASHLTIVLKSAPAKVAAAPKAVKTEAAAKQKTTKKVTKKVSTKK